MKPKCPKCGQPLDSYATWRREVESHPFGVACAKCKWVRMVSSAAIIRLAVGDEYSRGYAPVGARLRVGDMPAVVVEATGRKIRVRRYDPGPRPGCLGHTPETRQRILDAIREGLTDRQVAAKCRCSSKTAWRLRNAAGIVRPRGYRKGWAERRKAA